MSGIALFGGTFDPPHNGHIQAAQKALKKLPVRTVFFVPAYTPPHKTGKDITPPKTRLKMTELAVSNKPHLSCSDFEITREKTSYTIDTVNHFIEQYPNDTIYFLTGTDSLEHLHTWKNVNELLTKTTTVLITRPEFAPKPPEKLLKKISPKNAGKLEQNILQADTPDISSTRIRNLCKQGTSIAGLVPPCVEKYIEDNGLYQG